MGSPGIYNNVNKTNEISLRCHHCHPKLKITFGQRQQYQHTKKINICQILGAF